MRRECPRLSGMLALLALTCPLIGAEEAWRDDGRRLRGRLTLDGEQLRFQPSEGAVIPSTDLRRIRFPQGTPTPFRAGSGRVVRLWDGEQISGQILDIDKDTLRLRTAWTARLELPRAAVASVEALPGWRTVIHDDFRDDLKAFALEGELKRIDAEDGARALVLSAIGQKLSYTLPKPLAAGRVGVNFREQEKARGARWTVELLFQQSERSHRVTATLAGESEHYTVDVGERGRVSAPREGTARTPGWHRLLVQFSKRSLRLTCDDEVLWYNLDDGPGGELRRVTIHCQRGADGEVVRGAMAFSEFCIERAVDEHPKPPPDAEQDEVRFLDDDQLFGRILRADGRAVEIEGRFGKRSPPWTAVSGCGFRRPAAPPKGNEGAKVRLFLTSGLSAEPDVMEGVVTALDDRKLVLRHALLGALTFERGRVRELRPLPSGAK